MTATTCDIIPFASGGDNYSYLVRSPDNTALVVDPTDAEVITAFCTRHRLNPTHILTTHHHNDHTAGVAPLAARFGCTVVGLHNSPLPGLTLRVRDESIIEWSGLTLRVLALPGHTADSCGYYCEALDSIFTGDTLFLAGCGRLLGGSAEQLFASLQALLRLPDSTRVWCGHEYTLDNLAFARSRFPDDPLIIQRQEQERRRIAHEGMSIPGTMGEEKRTNPFYRAANSAEFAVLRREKDRF